ncbi:MAG: flagellar basal body rod protein FlgC, partial [Deltaproteobacteria bacterium]|nr:flagellar basal body rod protein FlgC [Deltaproteobacteria bacterium]
MDLVSSMHISATGLSAHRVRMNIISMNLANVNTTRTAQGGPYRRRVTIHQAVPFKEELVRARNTEVTRQERGVKVIDIVEAEDPF